MEALMGSPAGVLPTRRAWYWCAEGLRLWRRYPLRLCLLGLTPLLVEALLQLIPLVGVALSKIIVPLLGFGLLQGLVNAERSGILRWSSPFCTWTYDYRWRAWGLAALTGLIVFGTQQSVAALVYGWPVVDAVLLGHVAAHPGLLTRSAVCVLMLPGVPLAMLLGLAPMFLMLRSASPFEAIVESARVFRRHLAPFMLYTLLQLLVLAVMLAMPFGILLIVLWAPWMTASWYVMWKDIEMSPGGT